MNLALVLIAHGSRRAEANRELLTVADGLRRRGFEQVHPAYLELTSPTIAEAGRAAVAAGADQVLLLPYFLSAGRHALDDLEAARLELIGAFPNVRFLLAGPLGPHPLLEEILIARVRERLDAGDEVARSS